MANRHLLALPDTETGNNPNDGIQLHVVVTNMRSIQTQTRFDDFKVEVDEADFEVLLFTKKAVGE